MISITRKENRVVLAVDSGLPVKMPVYLFSWETPNDSWAELLKTRLEDRLYDIVTQIRRIAYAQGYRDGRDKRKRTDWFSGRLNV